jgi:hypothetical protein
LLQGRAWIKHFAVPRASEKISHDPVDFLDSLGVLGLPLHCAFAYDFESRFDRFDGAYFFADRHETSPLVGIEMAQEPFLVLSHCLFPSWEACISTNFTFHNRPSSFPGQILL